MFVDSGIFLAFLPKQIGMQVELHAHPGIKAQTIEMEQVLRLLPSCVTGDNNEVRFQKAGHVLDFVGRALNKSRLRS